MKNKLFLIFILVTLITSWFSIGFYNVDEHFQILEFGGWKAGWIPQQNLSWEFSKAIRSSVEPFVVFLVIKGLEVFHTVDPFIVAFIMRLITAAMCISCFLLWRNQFRRITNSTFDLIWYDAALLLWFLPYLCVRSSSEIWGGCLFFISLSQIYGGEKFPSRNFFLSGAIAALAFFLRFQTGFLIAGVLIARLFHFKKNFKNLFWYAAGLAVMSALNVGLDYLFYHRWCFTPWNYFSENILAGKAATYSTDPFYYYVPEVLATVMPLQGLAIIFALVIFIARKIRDEISIGVLIFLAAHFFTAHKEIRFLFPIIFILPFVFASSMQWVSQFDFMRSTFFKIVMWLTIVTNLILLPVIMFKPADTQVSFQKKISEIIGDKPSTLIYVHDNPFERVGVTMEFYKNQNLKLLPGYLKPDYLATNPKEPVYVVTQTNTYPPWDSEKKFPLVYQSIPQWLTKFDFNNWLERTKVFQLYRIR